MAVLGHYAKKRPSHPSRNKKNTLAGPQFEICIFRPLRACSVLSLLVSNFDVSHPSRNQKNGPPKKTVFPPSRNKKKTMIFRCQLVISIF